MSESQSMLLNIYHIDKDDRGIRFKARAHRNRIYDYRETETKNSRHGGGLVMQ